jgi:DNA topoisomerase-1
MTAGKTQNGNVVLATQGMTWEHGRIMLRVAARFKEKKKIKNKDGEERTVYVYSERQIALRNAEKARKVEKLKSSIEKLRAKVKKDLRSEDPSKKLTALAVALIDATYERVGNDESADERGHFGVTGWQRGHLSFGRDGVTISYTGKSGVKQKKKVTDAAIKKALRDAYEAVEGEEAPIFEWEGGKITASKVNAYLQAFDVTAKDLRGFHANNLLATALRDVRKKGGKLPTDKKERKAVLKEEFKSALEETAQAIGHEAATLRSQYLVPGLEKSYVESGKVLDSFSKSASLAEKIVLRYLYAI